MAGLPSGNLQWKHLFLAFCCKLISQTSRFLKSDTFMDSWLKTAVVLVLLHRPSFTFLMPWFGVSFCLTRLTRVNIQCDGIFIWFPHSVKSAFSKDGSFLHKNGTMGKTSEDILMRSGNHFRRHIKAEPYSALCYNSWFRCVITLTD